MTKKIFQRHHISMSITRVICSQNFTPSHAWHFVRSLRIFCVFGEFVFILPILWGILLLSAMGISYRWLTIWAACHSVWTKVMTASTKLCAVVHFFFRSALAFPPLIRNWPWHRYQIAHSSGHAQPFGHTGVESIQSCVYCCGIVELTDRIIIGSFFFFFIKTNFWFISFGSDLVTFSHFCWRRLT